MKIQPNDVDTHTSLATALMRKGAPAEAIREFQIALENNPQSVNALNYLSWALATCSDDSLRKGDSAVALAEQARNLTNGRDPLILRTLAAAYAETGNYSKAIEVASAGLTLAREQKNPRLAASIQKELALYQVGSPYLNGKDDPRAISLEFAPTLFITRLRRWQRRVARNFPGKVRRHCRRAARIFGRDLRSFQFCLLWGRFLLPISQPGTENCCGTMTAT